MNRSHRAVVSGALMAAALWGLSTLNAHADPTTPAQPGPVDQEQSPAPAPPPPAYWPLTPGQLPSWQCPPFAPAPPQLWMCPSSG